MTAPTRTAALTRGKATAPAGRRDPVPSGRHAVAQRGRSPAVARAYARRAQRTGMHARDPGGAETSRAPFVMLIMVLLAVTLVATLWLSTAATADSYHLDNARKVARQMTERSESLSRQVATLETAPELARRARELGMVPAGDAARLVVRSDGTVTLVGQPRRATAPVPPPAPPVSPIPQQAGPTSPQPVPAQPQSPAQPQPVTRPPAGPIPPAAAVSTPPIPAPTSPVPNPTGRT